METDPVVMNVEHNTEQNYVLIVIDPTNQPVELKDGLSKLIAYAPHHNLVSEDAMGDESSEFTWHIK